MSKTGLVFDGVNRVLRHAAQLYETSGETVPACPSEGYPTTAQSTALTDSHRDIK